MTVLFETVVAHVLVSQLHAQLAQYFPAVSVYSVDAYFLYHEIVQKVFVRSMFFPLNNLVLFPSVKVFVAYLQLQEVLIHLLQTWFVVLNSQGLVVHG